jgi:hypothetical protein
VTDSGIIDSRKGTKIIFPSSLRVFVAYLNLSKAVSFLEPLYLRGKPKKIAAKPLCVENAQHFLLLT